MKLAPTRKETTAYLMLLASTGGFVGFVQRREEILEAHVRWDHNIIEAEHHFFPALLTEANRGSGIRIVRIVG
jgi:hypothetical protein